MSEFIDFTVIEKSNLDMMVRVDKIMKMQVISNNTRLILTFTNFEVDVTFDRKNPKANELMKYLAEGNSDISSFADSIKSISSH